MKYVAKVGGSRYNAHPAASHSAPNLNFFKKRGRFQLLIVSSNLTGGVRLDLHIDENHRKNSSEISEFF
jgi:hypothetical protein